MRKIAFLMILLFVGAVSAYGQNYELSFKFKILDPVSLKALDTVHTGRYYTLNAEISNGRASDFNGDIKFAVSTNAVSMDAIDRYKYKKFELPDAVSVKVPGLSSVHINIGNFYIDERNFAHDTPNIVIVWPNETISDMDTSNNFGQMKLYVIFDGFASGIENHEVPVTALYPNPAQNNTLITFNAPQTGTLYLTDITGKLIAQYGLKGALNKEIDLQRNGNALPAGLYLLKLETACQQQTLKLLVK
jgi:hypothetical protein